MSRIIFRALNFPILIFIILITIAIQSALANNWLLSHFQPDLILIVIVWCALRRSFEEGGIITLLIAEVAEIHSSTPQGLFFISYMAVYLAVRLADRSFVIQNLKSYSMVVFFSSIGWKIVHLITLSLLGAGFGPWKQVVTFACIDATVVAIVAIWVFRGLERFDLITYKNDRTNHDGRVIQDLDDELGWNSEGF